jgi:hypothetical protein
MEVSGQLHAPVALPPGKELPVFMVWYSVNKKAQGQIYLCLLLNRKIWISRNLFVHLHSTKTVLKIAKFPKICYHADFQDNCVNIGASITPISEA